ncbi:MAG: aminotransferase class I/II-fold pyridoxal phosphate-dependent enzyme, partial [Bacteroidota bacterium]
MGELLEIASEAERDLWKNLRLGYTESQGHPLLRAAVLQHYAAESIEQVVVASPGELNFVLMNVLLDATDHVITVGPCYQSLSEVVEAIGCAVSFWQPDPGNWTFDPAQLATLVQPNTKLLILNFPHNPTGAYLSRPQLDAVLDFARAHGLYVFSDEMYRELVVGAVKPLPPASDLYEKAISLWGTSKTFGLAGLRIGWLVSQDTDLLAQIVAFKDYLSICSSAPSEILSLIALNHLDHFLQPNLAKIKTNVALFETFVNQHDLFSGFIPPFAGSTAFVPLNISTSARAFSDRLVTETGIMTVPSDMFGYEGKYIRVGFGRANFEAILEALGKWSRENDY